MRNISSKFIILHSQRELTPFENMAVPDTDLRTLPFSLEINAECGFILLIFNNLNF